MHKKLVLGEINGVFGVQGWNKVFSDTVPRDNIVGYEVWYLSKNGQDWSRYEVTSGRTQGKNVVVKLAGVDDREAAQVLVGNQIAIDREQLPSLSGDEYYWSDLLGFDVVDLQQRHLGVLERMFETGANDVMVLRAATPSDANGPEDDGPEDDGADSRGSNTKASNTKASNTGAAPAGARKAGNRSEENQEILVPWIRGSVVQAVEFEKQTIVVDWDPDF